MQETPAAGERWRRLARADPVSRAGVYCWRCFCTTGTRRREERPFAAGEVCRAVLLHELATLRRGRELRFRKLRVLSFDTPQVRPRCGLWTGHELAAPRSSLSELGHLTANRWSHRLRRRHKAQDGLVSGGSGGPGGGFLARRRRVRQGSVLRTPRSVCCFCLIGLSQFIQKCISAPIKLIRGGLFALSRLFK